MGFRSTRIFDTVKESLLIQCEDPSFDAQILPLINSNFAILQQMGIGPDEGFQLDKDDGKTWSDFFVNESDFLQTMAIEWICLKTKLMFDYPSSKAYADAITAKISEIEARLIMSTELKRR